MTTEYHRRPVRFSVRLLLLAVLAAALAIWLASYASTPLLY